MNDEKMAHNPSTTKIEDLVTKIGENEQIMSEARRNINEAKYNLTELLLDSNRIHYLSINMKRLKSDMARGRL